MMLKAKILVVDDDKLICWSLEKVLEKAGYQVTCLHSAQEALTYIFSQPPDLVLLDLMLPDLSGVQVLERLQLEKCQIPTLIITAMNSVDIAVQAMKLGACDYISKPFNMEEVTISVQKALEFAHLKQEIGYQRSVESSTYRFENIICNNPSMKRIIQLAKRVAGSDAQTILIQGESGTGKDYLGRTIHYQSDRANHAIVEINCTALPETLLESELFGHERGAFTDAKKMKRGLFEIAEGGTILLEEIGDMPKSMQAKMLKVLEDRRIRRLGGVKDIAINVCIIATTNRNLKEDAKNGDFRPDLFYRFNVITITIPPLRERKKDILPLAQKFIEEFNAKFRRNLTVISKETEKLLLRYDWPGNVRQLRNVLERIMILEDIHELKPEHLPEEIQGFLYSGSNESFITLTENGISLTEIERNLVIQALKISEGNQIKSARLLHISRDSLRRKMKKYGLLT